MPTEGLGNLPGASAYFLQALLQRRSLGPAHGNLGSKSTRLAGATETRVLQVAQWCFRSSGRASGAGFWIGFGREVSGNGTKSGPRLPGPWARAVSDRMFFPSR